MAAILLRHLKKLEIAYCSKYFPGLFLIYRKMVMEYLQAGAPLAARHQPIKWSLYQRDLKTPGVQLSHSLTRLRTMPRASCEFCRRTLSSAPKCNQSRWPKLLAA